MIKRQSAGLLPFRKKYGGLQVFLIHPGGPFWKKKDAGAWSIPKGELNEIEEPLAAAQREFFEETGKTVSGNFIALTPVKQKSGKIIFAWAVENDFDAATIVSNTFEMEWPPRSGKFEIFQEVDKGEWFTAAEARNKINEAQIAFIDELEKKLIS